MLDDMSNLSVTFDSLLSLPLLKTSLCPTAPQRHSSWRHFVSADASFARGDSSVIAVFAPIMPLSSTMLLSLASLLSSTSPYCHCCNDFCYPHHHCYCHITTNVSFLLCLTVLGMWCLKSNYWECDSRNVAFCIPNAIFMYRMLKKVVDDEKGGACLWCLSHEVLGNSDISHWSEVQ